VAVARHGRCHFVRSALAVVFGLHVDACHRRASAGQATVTLPIWAYAGAGSLLAGALAGWTVRDWKADSDALEAVEAANKARDEAVAAAHAASASYEAQRAPIVVEAAKSENTIREIYRDNPNAACSVPDAAVVSLRGTIDAANRAATGQPVAALPAD